MVRQYLLEDAYGFSLVEQPLPIEQLLDLQQVEENGLVELLPVAREPLVSQEEQVLRDDCVLGQNGKFRFFVVLALLEPCLVMGGLPLVAFEVGQTHVGHLPLVLGRGVVALLLALEQTVGLDREDPSVGIDRQQLEEFMGNHDQVAQYAFVPRAHKPVPDYSRYVVPEHVRHQHVGVLAV